MKITTPIQIRDHHGPGPVPGPGFYRMKAAVYHADPAPEPSLSSSLIPMLALGGSSPAHVWLQHPRLGKAEAEEEDEPDAKMNVGSVAHELLLGHGHGFEVCEVKTWASQAAKDMKAAAIGRGKIPIKAADYERAMGVAAAIRAKLEEFEETQTLFVAPLADGRSEVVGVFKCPTTGIWGRFMLDRWGPDPEQVWDIKTSLAALSEDFVQRQIDAGLGARAWWYMHGIAALVPELQGRIRYRWIFAEQRKPHEVLIRAPAPEHLYVGGRQAITAALWFRHCLKTKRWPGFPRVIQSAQVKPWAARDWQSREMYSHDLSEISSDMLNALSPFRPELAGLADDQEISAS